jgi:Na+(H+)/acetate symporter ActP
VNFQTIHRICQATVVAAVIARVLTPMSAHAATVDASCKLPTIVSGQFSARIQREAERGMPAFRNFLIVTEAIYQLDRQALMAKLAAAESEQAACEARNAIRGSEAIIAEQR